MNKAILILTLPVVLMACGKEAAQPAEAERPASTIVVGAEAADRGNVYSGEVRARYETVLGFRIGGKIVERLVDTGAVVRKGQVLARLDAADTGLQESAANAQYRLAEEELKRYLELRDKGFVSESALDAKETALKAAAAQAGLARNQAAYTSLLSDRDGVVSAALAEVGQVVSAGQPVVRVAQQGEREVTFSVPESRFSSFRVGMPAEIELNATDSNVQSTVTGHVREISPAADPASRTYPVRVSFDAPNAKVALGMTARVRLKESAKNNAQKNSGYLIPLTAIFQQGDKAAVWIVASDRSVSLRPVEVAAFRDDGALIASGIAAGERIVSAGVHKLSAGEKIRIIENGKPL
ncbi:multidrug resistance protein MdtA precursor [mine drainage metagenome]|uniref:Multidrug resistance protein MdtA n=1 Tax=mine drainage metagenome TaxID=410659 RepID=A0A1J5THC8_9ZZZZ